MLRKKRWIVLSVCLLITLLTVLYTLWDNNRIVVRMQEIVIEHLPAAFDGFTILQISDLHGRSFGKEQSRLLRKIGETTYDIIVFTGDMNRDTQSDLASSQAVLDLVRGLAGESLYWVDGNCGPYTMERRLWPTGRLLEIGETLAAEGVTLLNEPAKITRADDAIYLTPKLSYTELTESFASLPLQRMDNDVRQAVIAYHDRQLSWYEQLNDENLTLIALDHYPEQRYLAEASWPAAQHLPYDLMLCGHNHGGQIRLPLLGAVYIPTISSARGGYFPESADVQGLQSVCGVAQYISAGLGASASFKGLAFRFLCPPEINQIVLRCK